MTIYSALHAEFNLNDAYPVPKITLVEFEQFVITLSALLGDERADAFAGVLLWVRSGIPARLVEMGLDDESAMVFADIMLDHQVHAVTDLYLHQIAQAVPTHVGMNSRALLLSTDLLIRLCKAFEYIAGVIESLTYSSQDACARVNVLDELARATGLVLMTMDKNPYVSQAVYDAVTAYYNTVSKKV